MSARRFTAVEEARRLRADGMTFRELSAKYGFAQSVISEAVSGVPRPKRDRNVPHPKLRTSESPIFGAGPDCVFVKAWSKRAPRPVIDKDAIMPAAKAFAAGKITRDEMMRRISL